MENVRVGVCACVINKGKFLIGERLSEHGKNTFSCPGGHMEYGEDWFITAKREVKEETNLDINKMKLLGITNDIYEGTKKHYITIFVVAEYEGGEPETMEKDKCKGWIWTTIEEFTQKKFLAIHNLFNSELKIKLEEELNNSLKKHN